MVRTHNPKVRIKSNEKRTYNKKLQPEKIIKQFEKAEKKKKDKK